MKKFLLILVFLLMLTGCEKEIENYTIVATIFPSYDFARQITKDSKYGVDLLVKPGSEIHDFEPTPQDILKIKDSRIFIYVGGESDAWVDKILNEIDPKKTKVIKLIDLVNTYDEEIIDYEKSSQNVEADNQGKSNQNTEEISEHVEVDEHVWTTPINAIKIVEQLEVEIAKIDPDSKTLYEENTKNYIEKLKELDYDIKAIIANAKRRELIFADRFPFRYFVNEYGLTYYAAFPGCSDASEPNAKTISFLINKIKEDEIPAIFKIELSDGKIAEAISKETSAKVYELNSAHNISKKDFESGITYVDIMEKNLEVLKEALN